MVNIIWGIIVVLFVLWVLGFAIHIGGSLIHILIVIAVVLLVYNLITGRGASVWANRQVAGPKRREFVDPRRWDRCTHAMILDRHDGVCVICERAGPCSAPKHGPYQSVLGRAMFARSTIDSVT